MINQEIFGSMLVSAQLRENETELPSPEQLKRRIILKGKILPKAEYQKYFTEDLATDFDSPDAALSQVKKTGKLYVQNQNQVWEPYFFALMDNKLSYIEIAKDKNESETEKVKLS